MTQPTPKKMSPWFGMLNKPRKTVRRLLEDPYPISPLRLAAIVGLIVFSPLATAVLWPFVDLGVSPKLLIGLLAGPSIAVVYVAFFGWVYKDTCGTLGGNANQKQTRVAVFWSLTPLVWGVVVSIGFFVLGVLVSALIDDPGTAELVVVAVSYAILLPLVIGYHWSLVALFKSLGEVSGFSVWKGWGAAILGRGLAAVVLLFPALIAFGIYAAFASPA